MTSSEFVSQLWEVLDQTPKGTDDFQWLCGKNGDRHFYAKELAAKTGFDLASLLGRMHVCCDCEIVFNFPDE